MTTPELRVLQVLPNLAMGGAETWVMALLQHLDDHRNDLPVKVTTEILITGARQSVFDQEARALGASVHYVPYTKRQLPAFVTRFRRLLKARRFHAVHDHQEYGAGWHFLWGAGRLPPVRVVHIHNPPADHVGESASKIHQWSVQAGLHLVTRLASHVRGTSRDSLTRYGFTFDRSVRVDCAVCHCGFDTHRFLRSGSMSREEVRREHGWPASTRIVLFVGRLDHRQKNFAFAFEVLVRCIERDPQIRLLVAGGGDVTRAAYEARARALGLSEHIRFLGLRRDIPRLATASDTLLLPSVFEGLGMIAVEAQAAGLRVLASAAVPRECAVVPGLVRFLPVEEGADRWAEELLQGFEGAEIDPAASNEAVRRSPFSIEYSARELLRIYASKNKSAAIALDGL